MTPPTPVNVRPFPPPSSTSSTSAGAGGGKMTKPGGALAILGTRNGQIGAAAAVVIAVALYRRYKTNAANAAAGTTAPATAGTGVTADTVGTDLYSGLQPLIEEASGFSTATNQAASNAAIQAALAQLLKQTGGAGVPGKTPIPTNTPAGKSPPAKKPAAGGFTPLYPGPDNPAVDAYLKALEAAKNKPKPFTPLYSGPDNPAVDNYLKALAAQKANGKGA